MHKTILMTAAAVAACSLTAASTAQDGGADLPSLGPIMEQVSALRNLEFLEDVPAEAQSMEDFAAYIKEEFATMFPEEFLDGMTAGLFRLGLLTEEIDFGEEMEDAILSQAGGYYDPVSGTFYYLMTDMPAEFLETIAAHELVHALQDQHYDLNRIMVEFEENAFGGDAPRDDDRILAIRSLVEGEATYVQMLWQFRDMDPDLVRMQVRMSGNMDLQQLIQMGEMAAEQFGADSDIGEAMASMKDIPPYILYPLYAAYMKGATFVAEVHQAGGWDAVAAIYDTLPGSTEQTLHPEKFTGEDRDERTEIALPQFARLVDADCEMIDSAIHGEYYMELLLRNFECPRRTAQRAAAGWDGDVYQAWRGPDGNVFVVLATTWDTEDDAEQFARAYAGILDRKYVGYEEVELNEEEGYLLFSCGEKLGHGLLMLRGQEVFLVEGADGEVCDDVMMELIGLEIARK